MKRRPLRPPSLHRMEKIKRTISLLLALCLLAALCGCGAAKKEVPAEEPAEDTYNIITTETVKEPNPFERHEPVRTVSAKPGAEKEEPAAPKPEYEIPDGSVIPFDSTVGFTFGEGLRDYTCTDVYLGDMTPYVKIRESGGLVYYGVTDSYGNFVEVSREITGKNRVVYLTFDDGPCGYTPRLLDTLAKYDAKATFFVIGVMGSLDICKRMVEEGHSVGAHSYSHDFRTCYSSVDAYFEDLQKLEDMISEQIGYETPLVRFPGGSSNAVAGRYCSGIMSALREELPARGYQYFDWNVSSADGGGTEETSVVTELVKKGISSNKVSVVLQHDIKLFSVKAVDEILRWGTANGYLFLPLNVDSTPAHHGAR